MKHQNLTSILQLAREVVKRETMPFGRILNKETLFFTDSTSLPFFCYIKNDDDKEAMRVAQEDALFMMTRRIIEFIKEETSRNPYTSLFLDYQFYPLPNSSSSSKLEFFTETVTISCNVYLYWQTTRDVVKEIQAGLEQMVERETDILDYIDETVSSFTSP